MKPRKGEGPVQASTARNQSFPSVARGCQAALRHGAIAAGISEKSGQTELTGML
jgi:hypothetical protein